MKMKVNAMTKSNPNSLTDAFDAAYRSTMGNNRNNSTTGNNRNNSVHSYVGLLEGMLTVLLANCPGSRERIIHDLKKFTETGW